MSRLRFLLSVGSLAAVAVASPSFAQQAGIEVTLVDAASGKPLANVARQHGFFTAMGREVFFTQEQLKQVKALLKDKARAEKRADSRKRKPVSTFGVHESSELRKQRRRTKKRQAKKEE